MAKRRKVGECKLCREKRELCHSHILPKFLFKKTYDENHKAISVTDHPDHKPRTLQDSYKEHLLCTDCEALLNPYETYSARLLKEIDALPHQGRKGANVDYDYHHFKLFGISLLWRAHVSKLFVFRNFSVGKLAEDMHQMLLNDEPRDKRMCPFGILRFVGSGAAERTMHTPVNLKLNGQHMAYFSIFGYSWLFVVSRTSHTVPEDIAYVGFTPKLMVAFERTTDEAYLERLRSKMSKAMFNQRN